MEELCRNTSVKPVRNGKGMALRSRMTGKGITLKKLSALLKIPSQCVLAMGDSHNDWDMLNCDFQAATTQNADDETKKLVSGKGGLISAASYSDGVAEVLKMIR